VPHHFSEVELDPRWTLAELAQTRKFGDTENFQSRNLTFGCHAVNTWYALASAGRRIFRVAQFRVQAMTWCFRA
jgi:hypothetical protein